MKFIITLIVLLGSFAHSEVFLNRQQGVVHSAKFSPERFQNDFYYDVLYYIPKSLDFTVNANTLVFLHGGGQSTLSREGSLSTARLYMNNLKSVAEELGFVLVTPSGSGLNWNTHTRSFLRDLNKQIVSELKVNPKKMGLSGHSMGGMGITRAAIWLADQYAFFLPTAAGLQESRLKENYLLPYFDFTYHHIQGLRDHFQVFVERCIKHTKAINDLEKKLKAKADFTMELTDDTHNYDKGLLKQRLKELFYSKSINSYQKEMYPIFLQRDEHSVYNGIEWHNGPIKSYFWISVNKFLNSDQVTSQFKVNVQSNKIFMKTISESHNIEELKLVISEKMFSLKDPIQVYLDGKLIYSQRVIPRRKLFWMNIKDIFDGMNILERTVDLVLKL